MDAMKLTLWFLVAAAVNDDVLSQKVRLEMPSTKRVSIGDRVVLTSLIITASSDMNVTFVSWRKEKSRTMLIYQDNRIIATSDYRNRVGFLHSKLNRDVSIYINNTTLADTALYTCMIITTNPDGVQEKTTNLSVLIPPSTPKCYMYGTQFIGHNVTLTCRSTRGKPVPTYTWQRNTPKPQFFNFPAHNSQMGTLILRNLTKEMSGLYICRSINSIGNASCSIQMDVTTSNKAGFFAGAIIGAFLGICLLVAIIAFFCIYQRKRKFEKEEDLANELKEDSQAPVGNVWMKNGSSDIISKNGTLSSVNSTMRAYKPYPAKPPSDTASTITAMNVSRAGSGKRPKSAQRPATAPTVNTHHSSPSPKWQNGARQQTPEQEPTLPPMSSSNLARMGAVPVMVPAQSKFGSLV
ncbi:endothelial cell-selective adhesion molecule isoform X1 [Amblyraja radiata]|uniref:endothelial cell-selective adhesion molecule isoform X1 n=2 Tax=Amblyraja radiata TaxID=386614 RepID=UPI0014021D39|nr:endothelial cell-selective adhesion molecule isoform X1 [Amblyraja radiata]